MKIKHFFLFLLPVFLLASCGKYEEGPAFSLRTKKARLVGKWKFEGQVVEPESAEWEFDKEGVFTYSHQSLGEVISSKGTWRFSSNKEAIEIHVLDSHFEFEILRLTQKELWIIDEDNKEWRLSKV
jgi:uncharacterized protein (TIGR03066 family)